MFYVITITSDSMPGNLFGPMEWDNAISKCIAIVKNLELDLSNDEIFVLQNDGQFIDDSGFAVYVICSEE